MLVHATLLTVLLGFAPIYWQSIVFVIVTHYLIDLAKLYVQENKTAIPAFLADQALHVTVLGLVAYHHEPFNWLAKDLLSAPVLLFITALILVIFVPAVLIKLLIAQWRPDTKDRPQDSVFTDEESLIRAGRFIGILERLFVFLFIIIDHWEAVGFLLTAKSIFRFGDLRQGKDRKLTEYVLIGTLLSFGSAILVALAYSRAVTILN